MRRGLPVKRSEALHVAAALRITPLRVSPCGGLALIAFSILSPLGRRHGAPAELLQHFSQSGEALGAEQLCP